MTCVISETPFIASSARNHNIADELSEHGKFINEQLDYDRVSPVKAQQARDITSRSK